MYPIIWDGREVWPNKQWLWSRERVEEAQARGEVVFAERDGKVSVRVKQYLRDENGVERLGKPVSVLIGPYNQSGTRDLEELFDTKVFDFPKPVDLIKYLISFVVDGDLSKDFVVLDFFAGSGSAAHAILKLNNEDGGRRRFIAVQIPEISGSATAAAKAGYSTLAELARERIRRAGKSLTGAGTTDVGFRTFKIDSTNMSDVLRTPDDVSQTQLDLYTDSVKPDRTGEDLLFQVLLDWGLELSLPIERIELDGREVFIVDGGALIACFDTEISPALVRGIAGRAPLRAVFRDSAFATDADRINTEQVFAEVSPGTVVKAI